jgi:PDZ domain
MDKRNLQIARISGTLIALALSLQMPHAAWADDNTVLAPESPTMDTTPSASPVDAPTTAATTTTATAATAPTGSTTLYGSAKKHLKPEDATVGGTATQNAPLNGSAQDNDAKLQAETASEDAIRLHAQATKKFDAGEKLSSEEYRSLGAGCVGYESDRTFFQNIAIISDVYKDSPADKAGIRKGDKVIDTENDDDSITDPSQPLQAVTCGRAGTPVKVTLLRNGHQEKLTLTRMNIEDIQEPKYRHAWEKVLRQLGYPKEGYFSGTSMSSLKQQQPPQPDQD